MYLKVSDRKVLRYAKRVARGELKIKDATKATSSAFSSRARKLLNTFELERFNKRAQENRKRIKLIDLSISFLDKNKSYVIGACLGDNIGNLLPFVYLKGKPLQRYTVGIDAGFDKDFAKKWVECIKKAYNINLKLPKNRRQIIYFYSKEVWFDLRKFASFGTYSWYVNKNLFKSKEQKINLLKGFFDAEGFPVVTGEIRVEVVNKKGLNLIKKLLKELGIVSRIRKTQHDKRNAFLLSITGLPNIIRFEKIIGFVNKEKTRKLKEIITRIANSKRYKYTIKIYKKVLSLMKKGLSTCEIAKVLKIPQPTIYRWVKGTRKPLWVIFSNQRIKLPTFISRKGKNKMRIGRKNKREILKILQNSRSGLRFSEIVKISGFSGTTVAQHLMKLKEKEIIEKVLKKWKVKNHL
jgi:hypothetical protein